MVEGYSGYTSIVKVFSAEITPFIMNLFSGYSSEGAFIGTTTGFAL